MYEWIIEPIHPSSPPFIGSMHTPHARTPTHHIMDNVTFSCPRMSFYFLFFMSLVRDATLKRCNIKGDVGGRRRDPKQKTKKIFTPLFKKDQNTKIS